VSLQGSLRLRGPGRIVIESGVIIGDKVDLFTHHADAMIHIGAGTFLNGTRFSAVKEIRVGAESIIGDARLMDTDFHWLHRQRRTDHRSPPAAPIRIENNVWIAAGAAVLKGTTIGANSVIGFGAVVSGVVPGDELWAGVPARRIGPLPPPPENEALA
jgi:acetyltransferase-like isoleucine patch superfamily enzyme